MAMTLIRLLISPETKIHRWRSYLPVGLICLLAASTATAQAPAQWEQPVVTLTEEIVGILGPGQARLTIRNVSSVPTDEIPAIRHRLEDDLKARGVVVSGAESANLIRVTLSERAAEGLWVAEVVEGNQTQVVMVSVPLKRPQQTQASAGLMLRRQVIFVSHAPVLAALETPGGLVAIEPEQIVIYVHTADEWREQKRISIGQKRPLPRDPRAIAFTTANGQGFESFLAGLQCTGTYTIADTESGWTVHCKESDDPWTIAPGTEVQPTTSTQEDVIVYPIKAFYNASRNYFTGVLVPSLGVDLPPFYSTAFLPRPGGGTALLTNGIDGKVQLVENGALKPVAGTRDWGSDFATLTSGCGAGTQIIASGSGEAAIDSLRAYALPALEAVPASPPLAVDGTVTALWTPPDGKSVIAVVRTIANEYEVDRVTALCN